MKCLFFKTWYNSKIFCDKNENFSLKIPKKFEKELNFAIFCLLSSGIFYLLRMHNKIFSCKWQMNFHEATISLAQGNSFMLK
jgi:hypothetical protein